MYRVVHESYRRAVVRRFPYVVFYEHLDNTIIVYSVFHCSQDPKKWRSRLP
jgi:plasmid stabilization system protein ParE